MMEIGWIDFSKNDRNKALDVLNLLSEADTLDELGISPIRDGFANSFFPGTSTIQTRAKYFLCVPYAFKNLEASEETNPKKMLKELSDIEKNCGEEFYKNTPDSEGIIGSRALKSGSWVKRAPSDIYWAGIRRLGIFSGGNISIAEYLRRMCNIKENRNCYNNLGNRNDRAEENECDDKDAGRGGYRPFWNLQLPYLKDWQDNLSLELTKEEADFLKRQIISECKGSMLAYIIENNMKDVVQTGDFGGLKNYINQFPQEIRHDYKNAVAFSEFVYVLRIIYLLLAKRLLLWYNFCRHEMYCSNI